jgi:hypothetical protein
VNLGPARTWVFRQPEGLTRPESSTERLPCQVNRQLADEFSIAARLYAEAVVALARNYASLSPDEYGRLKKAVEEAQHRSEAMRIVFQENVESHWRETTNRCGQPN